jgi:putative tryptophan/tyrosine transport system substrate-binding protein
MRRRDFFGLIGGAAAWPLTARAQPQSARRIGFVRAIPESDPEAKPRLMAIQQGLEQLGWATGTSALINN